MEKTLIVKEMHTLSIQEAFEHTKSNQNGLSSNDAKERLEKNGKNALPTPKKTNILIRFLSQLSDAMIMVLIAAAIISAAIAIYNHTPSELVDSAVIIFIVLVNAVIGIVQEGKAANALDALKNMSTPYAKVKRDDIIIKIPTSEIVVGDIVLIEAGDSIPADLRLIECTTLKIEEAALTGESVPIDKVSLTLTDNNLPLGDRKNLAFSGSVATYGRGLGVVTQTGIDTQMGKIATLLSNNKGHNQTPLQKQLAKTAKFLSIGVLIIAAIIFGITVANGTEVIKAFMTAVAIAVAAIPEGLPAVVTIVLAMGVRRMALKKAIIRNLPAVEVLGATQVICSDKTGTLTQNKMTVTELFNIGDKNYPASHTPTTELQKLLLTGFDICNDTQYDGTNLLGDPTETALTSYALSHKLHTSTKRIFELPFDSDRKMMTVVINKNGENIAYTKGAADILLANSTHIHDGKSIRQITDNDRQQIKLEYAKMAEKALRVLGLCIKTNSNNNDLEKNMTFVGLIGMIDPPRPEIIDAIKLCKAAHIRTIMITGDHADTAKAIAKDIGIVGDIMTGAQIDSLNDDEFDKAIKTHSVFARVSPQNKVRIVKALKGQGLIVAMTGDGVNDAPSLKEADIGIGMGITGTDVSKQASDMVLSDDNFATIVTAVKEGRKIYSNIKKAIRFLLSANIAEVLCLFIVSVFLHLEFLTPVMILWVNLVTDCLPALALGIEKSEKNIMNKAPRNSKANLLAGKEGLHIITQGLIQTVIVLTSFCLGEFVLLGHNENMGMGMAFVSLCIVQLFHSYNCRTETTSLFETNPLSNKLLNLSFIIGALLTIGILTIPPVSELLHIPSLGITHIAIAIAISATIIPLVEIYKFIARLIENKNKQKI